MKLPTVSGRETIRAFVRAGWVEDRQEGSHVTLIQFSNPVVLTVPLHKELGRGLLRSLIRKAGMTVEQFVAFLD